MVTLAVTATPECTWTATTEAPWISDLSPAAGQGSGQVELRIAPNPTSSPRQAEIFLNDVSIQLTQPGQACTFGVTPPSVRVGANGGSATFIVSTSAGCTWTVDAPQGWLTVEGEASRSGPGAVELEADPNPGPERTATITVAGENVSLVQGPVGAPPPPGACTYGIDPGAYAVSAAGGTSSTNVSAQSGCEWTATSLAAWLTIAGSDSGAGSGVLSFVVAANAGPARSGTITVAGQAFRVDQAAGTAAPPPQPQPPPAACTFAVSPTAASVAASGGTGPAIAVTAPADCAWTASSTSSWLTVTSGASGSGAGTVTFTAASNSGAGRAGTLVVAGHEVTVSQAGSCSFSLSPTASTLGSGGGTGPTVSVRTTATCSWTATTSAEWISFTSATSGTGDGSVRFSVPANAGPARTGTILIGDAIFTVQQDSGCSIVLGSVTSAFGAGGGAADPVTVTAGEGCTWSATSSETWLRITSGAGGSGTGTVVFEVDPNPAGSRTAILTIAGQSFTISQESGCAFSVAPTSFTRDDAAVEGLTIGVTTAAGCSWTAVSDDAWISITDGASGTGTGTVVFSLTRNRGNGRTGTLTVAGTTVTVVQD